MKTKLKVIVLGLLILSQSIAQYEISKFTINSGGSKISSEQYELSSSIGQVDASIPLTAENYQLTGGFWQMNTDLIFTNSFE